MRFKRILRVFYEPIGDMKIMDYRKGFTIFTALTVMCTVLVSGCEYISSINMEKDARTRVVFTTGFAENEVFRIEKSSCMLPEVMVYLTNTKNRYESVYGKEIWNASYDGETLEENIKDTVLASIARIKAMNLLAIEYGISLSTPEQQKVQQAAEEYFSSLTQKEQEFLGVDKDLIKQMYEEYALAGKVYEHLIEDINPEISDDEARTITVQHIFIKTYTLNENGEQVPYSEAAKERAYQRAVEAHKRAQDGAEFASLIAEYSDDSNVSISFGKGDMEIGIEEAAFNLGNNEISDIVETVHGYHIIKCINTFNRDETDRNKVKIIEQRRTEVFNEEYSSFVEGLTKNFNEELWTSVGFIDDDEVTTDSFFDIYRSIFEEENGNN